MPRIVAIFARFIVAIEMKQIHARLDSGLKPITLTLTLTHNPNRIPPNVSPA